SVRIAGPIPALVMRAQDGEDIRECENTNQQAFAEYRVATHLDPLELSELRRLLEDAIGNGKLADIVQQCAQLHVTDLLVAETQLRGGRNGQARYATMVRGSPIFDPEALGQLGQPPKAVLRGRLQLECLF